MLIAVTNQSTLVSDADARTMTIAVAYQVNHHLVPEWGITAPSVVFMKDVQHITSGVTVIGILDDADQAGDLGWHTEVQGGVVYGRVFARPVLDNGGNVLTDPLSVASVLSHEVIETAGDSACDLWADAGAGTAYARELCDAVESDTYPVNVPLSTGPAEDVTVSNFLLPAWFDPNVSPSAHTDFMQLCTGPFSVRPSGYTITMTDGTVSQRFGEHYPQWRKDTKAYPIARTARRLRQGSAART